MKPYKIESTTRKALVASLLFLAAAATWMVAAAETPTSAPLERAEALLEAARSGKLTDELANEAARLLAGKDTFVRGIAEWALATKVGKENNRQQAVWPRATAPQWYPAWASLDPASLVEADWVRQAVSAGIHRDPRKVLASVDDMMLRIERMAADPRLCANGKDIGDRLAGRAETLRALRAGLDEQQTDLAAVARGWLAARRIVREVVIESSPVAALPVLFVKQYAAHTTPNISRGFAWQHKPGGDICVLAGLRPDAAVRPILERRLGPGHVRGIDLWWEADRLVFAYAQQASWPPVVDTVSAAEEARNVVTLRKVHQPLRIYEINIDSSGLRQRTADPYWNDYEPTYGANGDIFFSSDRCARAAECGTDGFEVPNFNVYRVGADGGVAQVTASKDVDRYPHSLDNGLIAFTRWEYQERHFFEVHSVWTVRPDGTMADAVFKQHLAAPYSLRDTRSIPNSRKMVSIAAGHHNFAYGPLVVIDAARGLNAAEGIRIVTPGAKPQEGPMGGRRVEEGGVADQGGLYQTPWALSETTFLVSYAYGLNSSDKNVDSNGFAIYLIDVYGNKELVCRDLLLSCVYPISLAPRRRPPRLPMIADAASAEAVCTLADVYEGMPDVPRGTVKHLRIAQRIPWPFDPTLGTLTYVPGNAYQAQFGYWDWAPVRVIGTVPVAEDGSASFAVPPHVPLYFQALDENQMEVRRMRSMVSLAPGEVRGCRGCHESQAKTPGAQWKAGLALREPPRRPQPPSWGNRVPLDFEALIQPILQRRCTECHGTDAPKGNIELTSRRAPDGFLQSFRTMFGVAWGQPTPAAGKLLQAIARNQAPGELVAISDRFSSGGVTEPRQFGSSRSRLIRALDDDDHRQAVKLTPDERLTLIAWVDANAPYYGTFLQKRAADGKSLKTPLRVTVELASPFEPTIGESWYRITNNQGATGTLGSDRQ